MSFSLAAIVTGQAEMSTTAISRRVDPAEAA
jgi:hypothetical protein